MKLQFFKLSPDEQRLYFEQAAIQRNVSPVLMEKDFWVCWLLAVLFNSQFADALVFKGGTSLSKVFGAIDRFSEDIDLSLSPEFLQLPEVGTSRNQANKWMKNAEVACANAVEKRIAPWMEAAISSAIGKRSERWLEFVNDPLTNSPVLLFHYPTTQPSGFAYLKRSVKLEFGSLTDQHPKGRHPIQPLLADQLADAFTDWRCEVVALELERSFWEKATILHAEYHRPPQRPTPDRFSRHYADTVALAQLPAVAEAILQHGLRDRVVTWKSLFFGSAWARYDLAKPGTFRLVPTKERLPELQRDYEAMRDMYLSEPAAFEDVLGELAELEQRVNGNEMD